MLSMVLTNGILSYFIIIFFRASYELSWRNNSGINLENQEFSLALTKG